MPENTTQNFTTFIEKTGETVVNNSSDKINPPKEIRAVYLAFLEDQDAVMDYIVRLIDNKDIDQVILNEFIERIGQLGEIINQEKNKGLDEIEIKTTHNEEVKKILTEISQEKFKSILDTLKRF